MIKKILPPIIVLVLCLVLLFLLLRGCQQTSGPETSNPSIFGSTASLPSSVPSGYGQPSCDHNWTNDSCLTPEQCVACGIIQDISRMHQWRSATCTAPETCTVCGATQGGLTAHTYVETDRVDPTSNQPGGVIFTCVCGDSYTQEIDPIVSLGLEFAPWGEGKCIVMGIGTCEDTALYIPAYHEGAKVIGIRNAAFSSCTNLVSVSIPNTVESIGKNAFAGCVNLTKVSIADGVSIIEESAFVRCTALTEITIPKSVTNIAASAFYRCTALRSVKVHPDNPTYHSEGNCLIETASKTLLIGTCNSVIPEDGSVTAIGDGAFDGCSTLTEIVIPDSVVNIGAYAFKDCTGLTKVTIGNGVTIIGSAAFQSCENLTDVTVGTGLQKIGVSAFADCKKLSSIYLPESVTEIGPSVFGGCQCLTEIRFGGTKAQWEAVAKSDNWINRTGNYTIYCTDGEITK